MAGTDAIWALDALGLDTPAGEPLAGSMSSSGVYRIALEGRDAVLKVTRAGDDRDSIAAARRELDFYLTLARRLPIRTPRLIDHLATDEAVILLLSAHTPAEPAHRWDRASWLAVAHDLAALHDSPAPSAPVWNRRSWLIDTLDQPDLDMVWMFWSRPGEAQLLEPILNDTGALAHAIAAPAPCFLHGDCHAANLLRDGGSIVWADWQGAGVGSPAVDLAFPSVRGIPDDAQLPHCAMVSDYAALRGLAAAQVSVAVTAVELATFLLVWPAYARFNIAAAITRVHDRVEALARTWNAH